MLNRIFKDNGGMGRGGGGQGKGRGKGGGNKPGSGPSGACICPKCSYKVEHRASERCIDQVCPKCGSQLVRD